MTRRARRTLQSDLSDAVEVKRCPRCHMDKPRSDFYADKSKSNGRRFICKACDLERSRDYYRANREWVLRRIKDRQAAGSGSPDQ